MTGFILDTVPLEVLLVGVLVSFLCYFYATSNFSYWKYRSIPYEKPRFPFGTDSDLLLFKQSIGSHCQRVYNKFKDERLVGMFLANEPYLMIRDPELVRQILRKDFHHFVDRGMVDPNHLTPVNRHLFNMKGESWKTMRNKLTPAFTNGKMKLMYILMEACCIEFIKALEPIAEKNRDITVKDFLACFTADVIASCAFGLETNSLKNPDSEFIANGNKVVLLPTWQIIKQIFANAYPRIFNILPIELISNGSESFFLNIVGETLAYREKNGVVRSDFMDILIKLKNNESILDEEENNGNIKQHQKDAANSEAGLTLEEITAQALLFFGAGFETSSSAMSFCLYELSVNPDVQVKMRKEIDEVLKKHSGNVDYQSLQYMHYSEAVINETLRRYASVPVLHRQCSDEYRLPDMNLVIPKGMKLIIPSYAIHHDPENYPDPYKFDPERFTNGKIETKNNYTFMPFGEGPRMCIGNRFAMMQMKMCLAMILQNFELAVTKDTPIPINIHKKHFPTTPESPIVLRISKRKAA